MTAFAPLDWIYTGFPSAIGYYLVRERHNRRPLVLYWGPRSTDWRHNATRITALCWAGPIPEPESERLHPL